MGAIGEPFPYMQFGSCHDGHATLENDQGPAHRSDRYWFATAAAGLIPVCSGECCWGKSSWTPCSSYYLLLLFLLPHLFLPKCDCINEIGRSMTYSAKGSNVAWKAVKRNRNRKPQTALSMRIRGGSPSVILSPRGKPCTTRHNP